MTREPRPFLEFQGSRTGSGKEEELTSSVGGRTRSFLSRTGCPGRTNPKWRPLRERRVQVVRRPVPTPFVGEEERRAGRIGRKEVSPVSRTRTYRAENAPRARRKTLTHRRG